MFLDGVTASITSQSLTSITYAGSGHLIIRTRLKRFGQFLQWAPSMRFRISSDAKTAAWFTAEYQTVFNATQLVQPVKKYPYYMLASYSGGSSVVSTRE